MPRKPTIGEQFIEFLQQKLGQPVDVPQSTDVLRMAQYPGLEPKRNQPNAMEDMQPVDMGMLPQMPTPMELPMPGDDMMGQEFLTDELLD